MDRQFTQPKQVSSPTWGPPPPFEQALSLLWSGKRRLSLLLRKTDKSRQIREQETLIINMQNRPFSTCPKPLFQSEATCKAIDMKMKLTVTRKVLHLAWFRK